MKSKLSKCITMYHSPLPNIEYNLPRRGPHLVVKVDYDKKPMNVTPKN